MTETPFYLELLQKIKIMAAGRCDDLPEFLGAMMDVLQEGDAMYPDDRQKATDYAAMLLSERYPVRKEGVAV